MIANMEDGTVVLTLCSPIITKKITYFMRYCVRYYAYVCETGSVLDVKMYLGPTF